MRPVSEARGEELRGAAEGMLQSGGQWQERTGLCLSCNKEPVGEARSGRCSECGALLLRQAFRRDSDEPGEQDAALAKAQVRALSALDFRAALSLMATRVRLAQSRATGTVPGLLLEMSAVFGALGDATRRQAYAERALALFRETGQSQGMAHALCVLGRLEQERGRLDNGLSRCHEALTALSSLGDRSLQGQVELTMAHLLETTGLQAQALEVYRRLTCADAGARVRVEAVLGFGRCMLALGELQVAFGCFEQADALSRKASLPELRPQLALGQAQLFLAVRDAKLAGECLDWAESRLQGGDPTQRIELAILRGRHSLLQGHLPQAEKTMQTAADQASTHHVSACLPWARYTLALVRRAQGRTEDARSLVRGVYERAGAQDLRELSVLSAVFLAELDRNLVPLSELATPVESAHAQAKELRLPDLLWRTSLAMAYLSEARGDGVMEKRYLCQAVNVLQEMREKYEAFRRGPLFFTDPEKLRLYQHWAARMLEWDERPQVEMVAQDCEEPALAKTLNAVLFPA